MKCCKNCKYSRSITDHRIFSGELVHIGYRCIKNDFVITYGESERSINDVINNSVCDNWDTNNDDIRKMVKVNFRRIK